MKIATQFIGVFLLTAGKVLCQECATDGTCDTHERCSVWKEEGECIRSKEYMKKYCPVSCVESTLNSNRLLEDCGDVHLRCPMWAKLGECITNTEMTKYCAKSCNTCELAVQDENLCHDNHENCRFWADGGECSSNPVYMNKNCARSCGTCGKITKTAQTKTKSETIIPDYIPNDQELQNAAEKFGEKQAMSGLEASRTLEVIQRSIKYMASDQVMTLPETYRANCRNKNELCSFWAGYGECNANEAYMKVNCAPACMTCHLIDMATRCPPLSEDTRPALRPGDLNKMFQRIVATAPGNVTDASNDLIVDGMTYYSVQIHSRPSEAQTPGISLEVDKAFPPWVITLDNFVTAEECEKMIELGYAAGYKRSEDVGRQNVDGTLDGVQSNSRTSENAWCSLRNGCRGHPTAHKLHERISKVLGIPAVNSEDFQILRYEVGQFYRTHHDYIPNQRDRQCGPRILTFFIYLSDVEVGGGTDFPELGITIMPKKGTALLWPSVYDADPLLSDPRTSHQALPVEDGRKFAANGWIHMYDYITPQARGCN